MAFWQENYQFIKEIYEMRHTKMAEWMENVEKVLIFVDVGAMRQTFIFFVQAIARIMADKVYTSAEFKRERDNFQVNDFHSIFFIDNKLWFAGPLQGSWAYWGEEVAQPDPWDPDGREGQVPAGDREWEAECAH